MNKNKWKQIASLDHIEDEISLKEFLNWIKQEVSPGTPDENISFQICSVKEFCYDDHYIDNSIQLMVLKE